MESNNTIEAFHISSIDDTGALNLNTSKMFYWHIPKHLRKKPIEKGDIVLVPTARGKRRVLVMDVFREEDQEKKKKHKKVIKLIEKSPESPSK